MKDPPLFEKLMRQRVGDRINSKFIVEIAEVYFEGGDISKAQELLNSIQKGDTYAAYDAAELQKKILKAIAKTDQLVEMLTKEFKDHYSEHTLKELIAVVGEGKLEQLCTEAIADILANKEWEPSLAELVGKRRQ